MQPFIFEIGDSISVQYNPYLVPMLTALARPTDKLLPYVLGADHHFRLLDFGQYSHSDGGGLHPVMLLPWRYTLPPVAPGLCHVIQGTAPGKPEDGGS